MRKGFVFLISGFLILIVYFLNQPNQNDREIVSIETGPLIRSEVFGGVAEGEIYTSLIDLSRLESFLPTSTPYFIKLSSIGELVDYERLDNQTGIDYQAYEDGIHSKGIFTGTTEHKDGSYEIVKSDGEMLNKLVIKDNPDTDIHGLTRLKNGNFIVPSYKLHILPDGSKVESFVIEEQTMEGEVKFVWDSIDYVPIEEANFTEQREYWLKENINDYFHGNSVGEALDGNLLISGRNVNTIYKVDKETGEVVWCLGGKQSDFTFVDDPQNGFSHQHSVSQLPNGHILLFDNGNLHNPPVSRVVEYELDEVNQTARLVWSYSDGRFSYATGSVQKLKNGNTLVGWGIEVGGMRSDVPRIVEVNQAGEVVMNIYFPENSGFYNAFKY